MWVIETRRSKMASEVPNLIMAYWSLWSLICVHNGHLLVKTHSPISADIQAHQWLISHPFVNVFSHTHHFLKRLIKWVYKKCRKTDNFKPPISYILQLLFTILLTKKQYTQTPVAYIASYQLSKTIINPYKTNPSYTPYL